MSNRTPGSVGAALSALLFLGCTSQADRVTFTEPLTLGGKQVSVETLNHGREAYVQYCFGCHGMKGDGNGPAAKGFRPPPRDFTTGLFKFAGVPAGEGLPRDEEIQRIIVQGLSGTPMLEWDVPQGESDAIVQYLKTFYDGWKDPDQTVFAGIPLDTDPWGGKAEEAIARGKNVYHGFTQCYSCHAAYATKQEIVDAAIATKELGATVPTSFRPALYQSEAKEIDVKVGDHKLKVLPPDFLFDEVRAGTTLKDLYRSIAGGIQPAMPQWHGSLADPEIWALAYYVKSLVDMKDTPAETVLRNKLREQPEWTPPAPPEPPAEGDKGKEDDKAKAPDKPKPKPEPKPEQP